MKYKFIGNRLQYINLGENQYDWVNSILEKLIKDTWITIITLTIHTTESNQLYTFVRTICIERGKEITNYRCRDGEINRVHMKTL